MSPTPSAIAEREGAPHPPGTQACCWKCGTIHSFSLFCPACEAIQAFSPRADHFEILGIERRLVVDLQTLQDRYFELSRRLHPDHYQTSPTPARIASLGNTAALNRAYRTLRDPVERGLYWLSLQGESLAANNNRVPTALAELVFDVQEKLAELRESNGAAGALIEELKQIHTELLQQRTALLAKLQSNFERWDVHAADPTTLTRELKAILSIVAYLRTLIRDVDKALES